MGDSVDDIADLVHDFTLAGDATPDYEQRRLKLTQGSLGSLQELGRNLGQSATAVALQAHSIRYLVDGGETSDPLPLVAACSLYKQVASLTDLVSKLGSTLEAIKGVTECSMVIHLTSLGNRNAPPVSESSPIEKLLSHFDTKIKEVIRKVFDEAEDQDILWKAAEECYMRAKTRGGSLDADNYYIPLEESYLEWPFDPDFETEQYYEHQDRLDLDNLYAQVYRERAERRFEAGGQKRQDWVDFWARTLNNTPRGPTLFCPSASLQSQKLNMTMPRYLFRAFDSKSSGLSNKSVVASLASTKRRLNDERIDILSQESEKVAKLLHMHLEQHCCGGMHQDDLMSWTSSLLFAVQYAIYRAHTLRCDRSTVMICVIDTNKFPSGQFMRDTTLLEAYRPATKRLDSSVSNFFDFRLRNVDFYNGEYLSQGTVNHTGRSCTVTLDQLVKAGLFELYHELGDPAGNNRWPKRVLELRSYWSSEHTTTEREIALALKIGRTCFKQFELFDTASILLAFKNRKMQSLTPSTCEKEPTWAEKPAEVRRYWIITSNQFHGTRGPRHASNASRNAEKDIRLIFGVV